MKFKTDENLPVEFAEEFREAGHDAVSVYDQRLTGRPDVDIRSWLDEPLQLGAEREKFRCARAGRRSPARRAASVRAHP
jgi:hypothetical protein